MSVTVKKINEDTDFTVLRDNLQAGRLAEHENGSVVFVSHGLINASNPLNIANGIGGYSPTGKFRYLPNREITLVTDSRGYATGE